MIDPVLSLSFNLQAQHGVYALLLGSGVSRSASIPTGWELTLDLVSKLAHLNNENCKGNEVEWYRNKFDGEPDYSNLLKAVAPTSAAQQQLLKTYFEPSESEREEGKKLPTNAHAAIAQLVSNGYVRVIVTTNFDRLLETALESVGIVPIIIASSDAAKGAPPLAHSQCTVIKVHGDYLDHRIKNSPEALSKYDRTIDRLLDQVFDEYGLIVCGWSASYDIALRKALERAKSRRYPLYWTGLSDPDRMVKTLVTLCNGQYIKIESADSFFTSLLENVKSLEEFNSPHPLSTHAAVATLKRYLSENRYRIQLRDFLIKEACTAEKRNDPIFSELGSVQPSQESTQQLMRRLESNYVTLIHLFANGSYYATLEQSKPFFEVFSLIFPTEGIQSGYKVWNNLKKYPALLLAYAAGIAAIASDNYSLLFSIANRPISIKNSNKNAPVPAHIDALTVMDVEVGRQLLPNMSNHLTPMSEYLYNVLREPIISLLRNADTYERSFDDFEYIWCLLHIDAELQLGSEWSWTPFGAFIWRRNSYDGAWFMDAAKRAIEERDATWPPLKEGLFGGSIQRLANAVEKAQPQLDKLGRGRW